MGTLIQRFQRFQKDEAGQGLVEYVMLIALVIAALLIGGWGAVIVDRMKRGRKITANEGPEL